jgi:serine/threonine protein kinase/tetratricopeptide (TPR) repeat protein
MGEVYLARDLKLGRRVALKLLADRFTRDQEQVRRFQQEARAASSLNHPNIITIYEIGQQDDLHFIAAEYVEGETLRRQMARERIGLRETLDISIQVANALEAAHAAGIVHRDIKPENLMVRPDGLVKALDFGIAKLIQPRARSEDTGAPAVALVKTASGTVMGTINYMSPEQLRGLEVDARSDIFSLGVVLYEMIAGSRPFGGETDSDAIVAILEKEPAPISRHAPEAPAEFERIVNLALAKKREDRYQAIKDLLLDLKNLQRRIESGADQQRMPCPSCGRENPAGFAFCGKCGRPLPVLQTEPLPNTLELPAKALQATNLSASPEGERRPAAVVCSRLSGHSAMVEQLSPEEVEKVIARIKSVASEIIEDQGGVVERSTDEEMVALFGLPSAHEDDYLRAVRASLEIHARVRELCAEVERRLGEPVRMRTGVSAGALVTQSQSGKGRKIAGEALEVAERIVAFAEADEILISPETQRLIAPFFETEARGPFPVKPKSPPGAIHCVLKESGAHSRLEAAEMVGLTRYTGRDHEIGALRRSLEAALGGEGQFVAVAGEAGVGKSRLLLEFRRGLDEQQVPVLRGRCQSHKSNIPYLPFIDILRDALDLREGDSSAQLLANAVERIRAIDPNLEDYLPIYRRLLSLQSGQQPLADHLRGEELRIAILEALSAIFTLKAKRHPTVIFLEDWHWADEGSEEALKKLAGMLSAYPLMAVVTCRPERSFDWLYAVPHTQLNLAPLDAAGSISVIKSILKADQLPDGLGELLYKRTGGNPFFIEEVCRSLVENDLALVTGGRVTLNGSLENLDLPDTVQAVIRTRLDRLDKEARQVIRHASVIGREFNRRILERALRNTAQLPRHLENLQTLGLIQQVQVLPEPAYRFKHALTQEVAYESLLVHQRRSLHETVGRAIEELYRDRIEENLELLAHHFSRAENWPKAVRFGREGAEKASRLSRFSEALKLLEQTEKWLLKLPESPEKKQSLVNILLQQERQCETLGMRERQQLLIDRLLSLLDPASDQALLAEVYIRQGELYTLLSRFGEAEPPLNQSLAICRSLSDLKGERKALRSLGFLYWHQGRYEDAINCNEAALDIDQAMNDSAGYAQDLTNIGVILRGKGEPEKALEYLKKAAEIHESLGRPYSRLYPLDITAIVYRDLGDLEKAMQYHQQAYEITVQNRMPAHQTFAKLAMANLRWEQGDIEECLRLCHDAVERNRSLNMKSELAHSLSTHGQRLAALGRTEESLARLLEAADLFSQLGESRNEAPALTIIAHTYEQSAEGYEKCLATWERIRTLRKNQNDLAGEIEVLKEMARLARRRAGDQDLALRYLLEALDLAASRGDEARQGDLLNTMGIIEWERANYERALEHYEKAGRIFQSLNDRINAGLILNSIGVTLKHLGRSDEALPRLEEAVQLHRGSGQRLLEGHALAVIGDLFSETGSFDEAADNYRVSLDIRREIGDRKGEGWMLRKLAGVYASQSARDEARDLLNQAQAIADEIGDEQLKEACARLKL